MIKKLVTVTALAMLLGSPTSYASTTGNDLVEFCDKDDASWKDGFCYGYVSGIAEILTWASAENVKICMPDNVTSKQVVSVVRKYMKNHPEVLHDGADFIIAIALNSAFPCPD